MEVRAGARAAKTRSLSLLRPTPAAAPNRGNRRAFVALENGEMTRGAFRAEGVRRGARARACVSEGCYFGGFGVCLGGQGKKNGRVCVCVCGGGERRPPRRGAGGARAFGRLPARKKQTKKSDHPSLQTP